MTSVKVHKVSICVWVTTGLQKYGPLEQLAPDYLLLPKHWPDISLTLSQDQTEANRQCLFHAKLDTKLKYIVFILQWFPENFSFSWPDLQTARNKITFVSLTSHDIFNKQANPKLYQFISPPENKISLQHHDFYIVKADAELQLHSSFLYAKSKYNKI